MSSRATLESLLGVELDKVETVVPCPFHEDSHPSLGINVEKNAYHCFGCGAHGNLQKLENELKRHNQLEQLSKKIPEWHRALMGNEELCTFLEKSKGLSKATLKKFRIGWDGERFTIPTSGNVRRYLPGGDPKFVNIKGLGKLELYPTDKVKGAEVFICEGEVDTMNAIQRGYQAVTSTAGASAWQPEWDDIFHGKVVWVCLDSDEPGRAAAHQLQQRLRHVAKEVRVCELPTKDVTDLFLSEFDHNLRSYASSTNNRPQKVNLSDAYKLPGEKIGISRVKVAGKGMAPYSVPINVTVDCGLAGSKPSCAACPGSASITLGPEDLLNFIEVTDVKKQQYVLAKAGMRCNAARYTETKTALSEEIYVLPDIDFDHFGTEYQIHRAYTFNCPVSTNERYDVQFVNVIHPLTQEVVHVVTNAEALSRWWEGNIKVEKDELAIFRGHPRDKMEDIATELSKISGIVGRNDLIVASDLTFHSVLHFDLGGKRVARGWLELLVLGDTRTGKTETIKSMMEYYHMGCLVGGENATLAGLIGGLQQHGKRWILTWGRLPMNDGGLVAVDEMSGLETEVLSQFSGIRSSGVAEITKIYQERTNARVRLIWISNPRRKTLDSYAFGVVAVRELFGKPEDIARLDFVVTSANTDVPLSVINKPRRVFKKSKYYPPERCHKLLSWAWSLQPEQVHFTDEAMSLLYSNATDMGNKYSSTIPLVEGADQRVKLARMAAAAAVRTYNTDSKGRVVIEQEHVEYVSGFLDYLYAKTSLDYLGYSEEVKGAMSIEDEQEVMKILEMYPVAAQAIMDFGHFRLNEVEESAAVTREEAKEITSVLIRHRLLNRDSRGYSKTPMLIKLIRNTSKTERRTLDFEP